MSLLVDGYNLLHASGIFGRIGGARSLEHSRHALLTFIADSICETELSRTTVVFDAASAPPGLPREWSYRGIKVRFAPKKVTADEVIEQLILSDTTPRKLTVVSSDHRIQRAANRRKARAIDSDQWYAEVVRDRRERLHSPHAPQAKPTGPHTDGEVQRWMRLFGYVDSTGDASTGETADGASGEVDLPMGLAHPLSPFPPGYAEDITMDDV